MSMVSYSRAVASIAALMFATACAEGEPGESEITAGATVQILRGTDRAAAFTPGEARFLRDAFGVAWTGVYIGGPCSAGSGWTRASVEAIAAATGWQFLPIFVGSQRGLGCRATALGFGQGQADGNQTAALMRGFGWDGGRSIPVVLDIERSTFDQDPGGTTEYA